MMTGIKILPVTYLLSTVVISLLVLLLIVQSSTALKDFITQTWDDGGFVAIGIVMLAPVLLIGLLQIAFYAWATRVVLHDMRNWNIATVIAGALVTPLVALLDMALIANLFHKDDQTPTGHTFPAALFYVFCLSFVVTGALAYNDIKYRKPKALNMSGVSR